MKRWALRAGVSTAVIVVLLSIVPLDDVASAIGRVSLWTWLAAVGIFFAGHYLNAVKLWLLLGRHDSGQRDQAGRDATTAGDVNLSACVRAQYAGLVANLALPGLVGGDFARGAYLAPAVGLKRVTWASLADRAVDTATLLGVVVVALPLAGMPPAIEAVVADAGSWLIAVAAAMVVAGLIVLRLATRTRLASVLREVIATAMLRRTAILAAAAISLAVQSAFVFTNVWLAGEVGVSVALAAWFVAWPLSKLVAVLPVSLGGIGVREAVLVSLLVPYGAAGDAVLASGILWQGVLIATGLAGLAITQVAAVRTIPAASISKR